MRLWVLILLLCGLASAHTVDYQIDGKQAVVATVRLGEEPASYSEYELFAPDSPETPFQLGRSDALGRIAFVPDKPGLWKLKVSADSQHGLHGTEMEIRVDEAMIAQIEPGAGGQAHGAGHDPLAEPGDGLAAATLVEELDDVALRDAA